MSDLNKYLSEGWITDQLVNLVDVRVSNVDKKSLSHQPPVRLCNYMDVYSNDYITSSIDFMNATAEKSQISRFIINRGDVMITKDSETPDDIGITAVSLEDFENVVCGYHLALLKPYKDKICGEFLAKQLGQYKVNRQFANKANGSTRYGLTLNVIKSALIPFPVSVEKQQKIAHILTTCDTVIAETQSATAKYKAIKQGMLHDLFTRGLDANGKLRPSFLEAPELYKSSELGMIPKEWEVKRLEDIAFVNPSTNIPSSFDSKTQVSFLKMEDVSNSGSIIKNRSLPIENVRKKGFTLFQENDILFAKITPCMENGKGALATNLFNGIGYGSTEFHVFRPLDKKSISYVYFLSLSSKFRLQAESQMTGSAGQQRVSTKYLEGYKIAAPQLDEQFQIGVRLNNIENKIKSEEALLHKYQSVKQGMMRDLLSGKNEVSKIKRVKNKT